MIDLRSDTVTQPTQGMREAMFTAKIGDDVYGEDPSINALEALAANVLGFDSALFVPSGTQSNLIALMTHCQRGDEYIVGQTAHAYKYEGGGAAVLGGIQPQPLHFEPDGSLDLKQVQATIKPDDIHFARTTLLCLENTQAGSPLPLAYLKNAQALCQRHHLACHLDGARIFNAAVALGQNVCSITQYVDSVSCCLSKGLGAPVGSVLCGSVDFINRAKRWRKVLGGGMRQAGLLAAAGIYALNHHIARLTEDHQHALAVAHALTEIPPFTVLHGGAQTNMVHVALPDQHLDTLVEHMTMRGITIRRCNPLRLVFHLDIHAADVDKIIDAFKQFKCV